MLLCWLNSRLANNVENETKSFDTVKFQKAIDQEYHSILNATKRNKKGQYIGYINPHNGKKQMFLDKGRIWEQA